MKLFSNPVVSWREPASYTYQNTGKGWPFVAPLLLLLVIPALLAEGVQLWLVLMFCFLVLPIALLPALRKRLPSILPLTGSSVTLYEDQITLTNGRSVQSLALNKISECAIEGRSDEGRNYSVLKFSLRNIGFLGSDAYQVKETAIADTSVVNQVAEHLRAKGVLIKRDD